MEGPSSQQPAAPSRAEAVPGKAKNAALWVVQLLLAAAFLFFGGIKLIGMEKMVNVFNAIGIGQWFRYLTGLLEVGGALLLVIPALAGVGGVLLACVMAGAVLTHLFVIGGSPVLPLVLLALALIVAGGRRHRIRRLVAGR